MAAVLDIARYLIPVVGVLAAFALVTGLVFLVVPRVIELMGERTAFRSGGRRRGGA